MAKNSSGLIRAVKIICSFLHELAMFDYIKRIIDRGVLLSKARFTDCGLSHVQYSNAPTLQYSSKIAPAPHIFSALARKAMYSIQATSCA